MEKRRFLRIPISLEVEYFLENQNKKGEIKDLSYGGVFIETEDLPPLGEIVSVVLTIEGVSPSIKIFLKGKVVRRIPGKGFALKFVQIASESLTHLKNLLYFNSPSPEKTEKELREFLGEAYPLAQILKTINISALKDSLMDYILERAFMYSPEEPFTLASGEKSPYYLDCRKATLYTPSYSLVGSLFWEEIRFLNVQAVAGMSIGADPIVGAILAKAAEENVELEGLLVRKEPKKYGTKKLIEGNVVPGQRVVVVEDVITTGGSVLKAVESAQKEGLVVAKVLALVDREAGGRERIESEGYSFFAFFTLSEIIEAFEKRGLKK